MAGTDWHYDRASLADGLRAAGVERSDLVFAHVGLGMLGFAREGRSVTAAAAALEAAFQDALGDDGTLVVPTYTYSYPSGEVYDPEQTPSTVGPFTDYVRGLPGARRSIDPIFSVAAVGPLADELLDELPHECVGEDSVYGRLRRLDGKVVSIGVGFRYATFVHHVEQMCGVPYRYLKLFAGCRVADGEVVEDSWTYNVRPLEIRECDTMLSKLEPVAREAGIVGSAAVGRGEIVCTRARDFFSVTATQIERDPWFLAVGPPVDVLASEAARVAAAGPVLKESPPGPLRTGTIVDGVVVPERWTCHEQSVETLSGEPLPLEAALYSQPFDGLVTRAELSEHLSPEPVSVWPRRTWMLCGEAPLIEDMYRIRIRASFSVGMVAL